MVSETVAPLRTLSQKVASEFLPRFQGNDEKKSKVTGGLMRIIINQVIHPDKVLAGEVPPHTFLTGLNQSYIEMWSLNTLESIFWEPEEA